MSLAKKIAYNSGFLLVGRVVTKVISLLIVVYMARYLGSEDFGTYNFALSFVSLFTIISELGLHGIVIRESSRNEDKSGSILGNSFILSSFLSIIAFFCSVLAIGLLDYSYDTQIIVIVISFGLLLGASLPYGIIYEISFKMKYSVFFSIASRVVFLLAIFFVMFKDYGLMGVAIASVLADTVHKLLMYLFSFRILRLNIKFDYDICKRLLRESLPLAFASLFGAIYFRIDIVMLSLISGNSDVGIYSGAYRLTEAFLFIPSSLMVSLFPLMSKYYKVSSESLIFTYLRSTKYILIIALLIAILSSFYADFVILTIYGVQYLESIRVLQILIFASLIIALNFPSRELLVSIDKQKYVTLITIICAIINICLNYMWIIKYSYIGAAVATLVTEIVYWVFAFYYIDFVPLKSIFKIFYGTVIPGVIVSAFLYVLLQIFNSILWVPIVLICYLLLIYLFGGIDNDDVNIFKKVLGR
ncbi:membrane protein involved in the export of O-antigen and teichoic acid [Methanolobus tindarius DSM 2278]|uniref:Membrane protein involved in the export of O-antigen and teichoic acid n=1 Tax=Methanolobus tindarius DSM 2278 TaxID=1090322 RepID=W9DU12_METTI|nr:flippase [Methanolobus tindarius]ETA69100.1 membrane protein involved in the export of O-antigen and teichoic acid [Methanolobus tindarius DSM 2278]